MPILCPNPTCPQPRNADQASRCNACGAALWLCDRYRLHQILGQGGFGRTFLATDHGHTPPRPCVVKQMWRGIPASLDAQGAVDRFHQEVQQLEKLGHHPQIPALLDAFATETEQFLVQQYIAGITLKQELQQQGTFPETKIRQLLKEALTVLQVVHQAGVIHRDIKPDNLIRPQDGSPLVLVDFGAAKTLDRARQDKTSAVIGSAAYAAPEQIQGKAIPASDLFSLGVTCIHLATGLHPFDLYAISDDRWVWVPYLPQPMSLALRQLVDKLLRRALRERYATAEIVLADLAAIPNRLPRVPKPRTAPNRSRLAPTPAPPAQTWYCRWIITQPDTTSLSLSPQGQIMASGHRDGSIHLWDLATGERFHRWRSALPFVGGGHSDQVTGLTFDPSGHTLISCGLDGTVRLWDLATYDPEVTLPPQGWGLTAVQLTPDQQWLVTGGISGSLQIWDYRTLELVTTLSAHQDRISAIALSPTSPQGISGSWDGTVCGWSLPQAHLLFTLRATQSHLTGLVLSSNGQTLFSGSHTGAVKVWPLDRTQPPYTLVKQQDGITALALSPNDQILAVGTDASHVDLWDWSRYRRIATLTHGWGITTLSFDAHGTTLATSSADEIIRVWCLEGSG